MNAQDFLNRGIAVIPLLPKSKTPRVAWRRYQDTLPTKRETGLWFHQGWQGNVAVVCGWQGLTVLDFDTMDAYARWLQWARGNARTFDRARTTYKVKTSRGVHAYFLVSEIPGCGKSEMCDIKGRGGYVLIPPSVHPSGARYTAMDDGAPILSVDTLDQVLPDAPLFAPPAQPLLHVMTVANTSPYMTLAEEIKARVSILSYFPDATPTGGHRWYMARCPWHDDRTASLWIDAERGICACYTGCTPRVLDIIGVYAKMHGVSNGQAIRDMATQL